MRVLVIGCKGNQGKKRMATIQGAVGVDIGDQWPEFDAACVCVPDNLKLEMCRRLVMAGKHVLVEKPLNGSMRELADLICSKTVYTAYNFRFEPAVQWVKHRIAEMGKFYYMRGFLANGTVKSIRESWRDEGIVGGVIGNVAVHLIDLAGYLVGRPAGPWSLYQGHRYENRNYDHVEFGCENFSFAAGYLSWRNTFQLDLVFEKGSLHVDCLCKFGPSTATVRYRNDQKPDEFRMVWEQAKDPTYAPDYLEFLHHIKKGTNTLDNDIWINKVMGELCAGS